MKLYSVYDRVSDFWQAPLMSRNDGEAVRGFCVSCQNPNIPENYLSDISLYLIGEFDECTGALVPCRPKLCLHGNDYTILSQRKAFAKHFNMDSADEEVANA